MFRILMDFEMRKSTVDFRTIYTRDLVSSELIDKIA